MLRQLRLCRPLVAAAILGVLMSSVALAQRKETKARQPKAADTKATETKAMAKANAAVSLVPENALGFVVVQNLEQFDQKIGKVAQELRLPVAGGLMMAKAMLGLREGIDDKGSMVMVFLPGKDGPPAPVVYVPVTHYKAVLEQLQAEDQAAEITTVRLGPQESLVTKKGNYALFAPAEHEDALKAAASSTKDVSGAIKPLQQWIGDHDVYGVVMTSAIKQGIGAIRAGMQQARQAFPADNDQFKMVATVFEIYDKVFATLENEVTHFGFGLRVNDNGALFVNSYTAFIPGGSLAQAGKDARPPETSPLAGLPAGPFVFAGGGAIPEAWLKPLIAFSAQSMQSLAGPGAEPLTEEQLETLQESMAKSMEGVRSIAFAVGTLRPGGSIYDNMSGVMKVDNAPAYIKNYEQAVRQMTEMFKKVNNPLLQSYELGHEKVGGVEALTLSMDISAALQAGGNEPGAQKMMELLFGKEGKIKAYVGPADKTTVALGYSKEVFDEVLASSKNKSRSLASDPNIEKTQRLLIKDAQWVGYMSPQGVLEFAKTIVQAAAPGGAPQLPSFPETPPIGFAARMTGEGLETTLVLPGEFLEGAGAYVQQVQQLGPGGAQPGAPPQRAVPQRKRP